MLLLTTISDVLRVVTGAAVATIGVHASWVDLMSGIPTPGNTLTAITTAATTTVVPAPVALTTRNIKALIVSNNNSTTACQITVQHFNGTVSVDLATVTLLASERLVMAESGWWEHYDANGALYTHFGPPVANLGILGTLAETLPRELCPEVNTTVAASGTLFMQAIYLKAGQLISNISLCSATTAAGTPTNYFFALYDSARNLLANSANQTTTAWLANTPKTLAMTTPYRVPASGLYYIGYFMTATTVATLKGGTAKTGAQLAGTVPILQGTSSTALTTALPNPAAAITVSTASIWAATS